MTRRGTFVVMLCAVALVGCSARSPVTLPPGESTEHVLADIPFFAQDAYQCGPAALAMVLGATGVDVTPEVLVSQVYLPGRRGSLQPELIATARRFGRVPYVIDGELTALLAELDAGRPVLVLQNLGFARWPTWHFAVVIGYDREQEQLVLHSGVRETLREPLRRFVRSWDLGERWGLVLLRPGELPAVVDPERLASAAAAFEQLGQPSIAAATYAALATRWPDRPSILFALAHSHQLAGELNDAEEGYRRLLDVAGPHPAVLNNLSQVLLARGCVLDALDYADSAIALLADRSDAHARRILEQTRGEALAALDAASEKGTDRAAAAARDRCGTR